MPDIKPTLIQRATGAAIRALERFAGLRAFAEGDGRTNSRATGRFQDPWFNKRYLPELQNQQQNNKALQSTPPRQDASAQEAKTSLMREKLFTTFQGGALRFLPMDDGITDETPEMRSEYLRILIKEPSVKSAMLSKIIAVVSSKMSVLPVSEDPMDKRVAKWTENLLLRCKGGVRKIGENILLFSLTNGHALNEKIYDTFKVKQYADLFPHGYIGLKNLKVKKPEDYRLEVDQFRNIKGVWSNRASRRFQPSYFVISSFMPMYENPAGTSDLRAAIRAYNLIQIAQQLRAIWAEQFSMPLMEGHYPADDNDAKAFLEAAIQQIRALGWYVAPENVVIKAMDISARGQSEFQQMIDDLRKEIYLCIVGSYLQAIEGDTVGGAGNSETHRSIMELFQWYLCEYLAEQINDQIIPDFIGLNFSGIECPRVTFAGITDGDLLQSASKYQAIKAIGLDLSKKKLREVFEVDAPTDDADRIPGDTPQQSQGLADGSSGLPGAAPDPLAAMKLSDGESTAGKQGDEVFAAGPQMMVMAMKYFGKQKLNDLALAREMRAGPDGVIDFGTMMRVAKYFGVTYKDMPDASVFDMEQEINDVDTLVLTTLQNPEKTATTFAYVTRCDLDEDLVRVHTPSGEEALSAEEFMDRWPGANRDGEEAKRRAVIFTTRKAQVDKGREPETPAPAKQSEDGGDNNDGDVDRAGGQKAGVGANRLPVAPNDMPAGPDGKDVYKLLNLCKERGAKVMTGMAADAAERMLKTGNMDTFFTKDELEDLTDELEKFMAPADLLGRASVMIRLKKAQAGGDKLERFSEMPAGIAETFAEARLRPMKPAKAIDYFESLIPSMNLNVQRWGDSLRRKTFTMAEAANKQILKRVQKIIADRVKMGDTSTGPEAIEAVLKRAGIHPKNPQYADMVFRTNYMDMHNVAAEEQRLDPDVIDEFPVWRYMGIRDGRQGKDHEVHFDKYYPAKAKFAEVRGERPYNCRCQPVPVYKTEWNKLKARGVKVAKFSELLEGGIADNATDSQFDADALQKGIETELEHTSNTQMAKEIAKDHLTEDPAYYDKLPTIEQMSEDEQHTYCSTQFNLPHAMALRSMGMADRIDDADLVDKGKEDEPHITVVYGIHDESSRDVIGEILKNQKPIVVTLRKSSLFEKDDCDVVKLDVESPELHELREAILEACPNTQTYSEYQPHVTLAYVQKGAGQKYVGLVDMDGEKVKLAEFCFCDREEGKTVFRLGGDPSKFDEIYHGPKPPGDGKLWQPMQDGPRGGKRWRKVTTNKPNVKAKPAEKQGKSSGNSGSKAPGSQMKEQDKKRLRDYGMVGTFPPHDVPLESIKIHQGSKEELRFKPLMQWDQKTKSGRISRQYRYTQDFHDRNAADKFKRVMAVEPHLEKAKKSLDKIIGNDKESWERRDAAAITAIIAETGLRPTDGADSVKHGHFGIASLQSRHCKVVGNEIHLDFIGKEGVRNRTVIRNPVVVEHLKHTLKTSNNPREPLWLVGSSAAAAILKETIEKVGGPSDVMLKDLRTIKATQTAKAAVESFKGPPPPLTGDAKKDGKMIAFGIMKMSEIVAKVLNNTPTQARDNYIHPEVFKSWTSRLVISVPKKAKV